MTQLHRVYVRNVESGDIDFIAETMRESDVSELRDGVGMEAKEALIGSVASSASCKTLLYQGRPCALGGVCPTGEKRLALVWMLANNDLQRSAVALARTIPPLIEKWGHTWGTLGNFVDARNHVSIAWLERLGFRVVATDQEFGKARVPFHWMIKGKSKCVPEVFRSVCSVPLEELVSRSHRATPTTNSN